MNSDSKDSTFPTSTSNPSASLSSSGLSSGAGGSSSSSGISGSSLSGSSGSGMSSSTGGMSGSSSGKSGSGMSSGGMSSSSMDSEGTVHRVAQAAHQAVDKLEQTLGSSGTKVMSMQQEYGEVARDQVKANPLAAVGIAFVVGIVFSKLFMR